MLYYHTYTLVHLSTLIRELLIAINGDYFKDQQLAKVLRVRDCRVFCPKWGIYMLPPPKAQVSLQKRDGKDGKR